MAYSTFRGFSPVAVLLAVTSSAWSQAAPASPSATAVDVATAPAVRAPDTVSAAPSTTSVAAPAEPLQITSTPSSTDVASAARSYSEQYGMLGDRSIFLKDRRRPRAANLAESRPATPVVPEQQFVLRGIVLEDADLRAYIEDVRTNAVSRVEPGATIARGQVVEIQADAIRFAHDGATIWVEVGQDMTGHIQVASADDGVATATTTTTTTTLMPGGGLAGRETRSSPPSASATSQPASTADIAARIEALRARRARSLGQ